MGNLNAAAIYITWLFLSLLVFSFILILFALEVGAFIAMAGFAGILLFGFVHAVLAYFVRCPSCNKCLTVQGFSKTLPYGNKYITGWSYVAVKWFSGSVKCIHCGSNVNTRDL